MSHLAPEELGPPGTVWPITDHTQLGVVHRVRIEASGPTVGAVSAALHDAAGRMAGLNGFTHDPSRGQEVYERDLKEPEDSSYAYSGRLILHPTIAVTAGAIDPTEEQTSG